MRPADFFNHWGLVRLDLLEMLDRFEARELSYTPFPCGWPLGRFSCTLQNAKITGFTLWCAKN